MPTPGDVGTGRWVLEDERLGDVLGEVAAGGGGVAGKGGEDEVGGAADAGLQRAAAPGGYPVCRGDVVQAAGLQEAADAGGLDVDDPTGILGGGGGGGGVAGVKVVLLQRHLDEQQAEFPVTKDRGWFMLPLCFGISKSTAHATQAARPEAHRL